MHPAHLNSSVQQRAMSDESGAEEHSDVDEEVDRPDISAFIDQCFLPVDLQGFLDRAHSLAFAPTFRGSAIPIGECKLDDTSDLLVTSMTIRQMHPPTRAVVRVGVVDAPLVVPLPISNVYTTIEHNIRPEEMTKLKFMPYIDETNTDSLEVSALVMGRQIDDIDLAEEDYVLKMAVGRFGSDRNTLKHIAKRLDCSAQAAQERCFDVSGAVTIALEQQRNQLAQRTQVSLNDAQPLFNYTDRFCRMCHVYQCSMHGLMHARPLHLHLPTQLDAPSVLHALQSKTIEPTDACSDSCFLHFKSHHESIESTWTDRITNPHDQCGDDIKWTKEVDLLLASLLVSNRSSAARVSCDAALCLGPPYTCQAVHLRLRWWRHCNQNAVGASPWGICKTDSLHRRYSASSTLNHVTSKIEACQCEQACTVSNGCPCAQPGRKGCEKFCACSAACRKRWTGCKCSTSQCNTRICPCFSALRECDPDVCRCTHPSDIACSHKHHQHVSAEQHEVVEPIESPDHLEHHESPPIELEQMEQEEISTEMMTSEDQPTPVDLPRAARKTAPPPPLKPADLTPRKAIFQDDKVRSNRTERRPKVRRELAELDRLTDLLDAAHSDEESHQTVTANNVIDAEKEKVCWNSRLRRGIKKHLVIGRSEIHGWGCFVAEPVAKGELLSEYRGEVLTEREGNLRGKVYDLLNRSYLFDANDQEMIDSSRYGTEIKFTNHDANRPNCFARVCVVDGDHRVGIFARRDIEAGEEITFDYQMKNVPSWYTEASRTTNKKRKVDDV